MKITKLTAKFFLVISLFASMTLADGTMGNGGFADDGTMGNGGYTCTETERSDSPENCSDPQDGGLIDSTFIFVRDCLTKLVG
ncbi:MAG: hypothetical protein ABIP06_02720 [Pyrinomonadaceae bacterium]